MTAETADFNPAVAGIATAATIPIPNDIIIATATPPP
jgi:hypothetical protein